MALGSVCSQYKISVSKFKLFLDVTTNSIDIKIVTVYAFTGSSVLYLPIIKKIVLD